MVTLNPKQSLIWFSVVSTILVLFGIVYTSLGLAILPVDRETLLPWEGAIYGALMMGWGTTLFCDGRGCAFDEMRLARGRQSRVVLTPRRRRQASQKCLRGDGDKKARSPGSARNKPLKPSRAGMP